MTEQEEEMIKNFHNQPLQFMKSNDPLTELQERWTSLIRSNAKRLIDYAYEKGEREKLPSPELHDIANEIDAFFTGLKANKK